MKFIYNSIDKLNNYLGPAIFYNGNLFSYNIYNFFFKKNIANRVYQKDPIIFKYLKDGYVKLSSIPATQIDELVNMMNMHNPTKIQNNYRYNFTINDELLNTIKDIINKNLLEFLKSFSNFNNMKIKLGNIKITRNYSVPNTHDKEVYSNFFHCDAYTCNLFKIFINLKDISEEEGPLVLVKKDKAKKFFKEANYKNRYSYNKKTNNEYYYINSGKKGDVLLCNTTEILHRAGDVKEGKYRDVLFLDFIAYPFEDSSIYVDNEKLLSGEIIKKVAKPKGFKNLIKLYKFCSNN